MKSKAIIPAIRKRTDSERIDYLTNQYAQLRAFELSQIWKAIGALQAQITELYAIIGKEPPDQVAK